MQGSCYPKVPMGGKRVAEIGQSPGTTGPLACYPQYQRDHVSKTVERQEPICEGYPSTTTCAPHSHVNTQKATLFLKPSYLNILSTFWPNTGPNRFPEQCSSLFPVHSSATSSKGVQNSFPAHSFGFFWFHQKLLVFIGCIFHIRQESQAHSSRIINFILEKYLYLNDSVNINCWHDAIKKDKRIPMTSS